LFSECPWLLALLSMLVVLLCLYCSSKTCWLWMLATCIWRLAASWSQWVVSIWRLAACLTKWLK
jgi:hypothetical protein